VTVSGSGLQATAARAFQYLADVTLVSVTPDFGPCEGGTPVRVEGTGLDQIQEVFIGPQPAVVVQGGPGGTFVDVRTGPANPGRHDVAVTTRTGRRVVLAGAFVFGATSPGLVAVTPDTGSQSGGTLTFIAGNGFIPGVSAWFDGREAAVVDDRDPALLKVKTPSADKAARVDVEVRWPDGTSRLLRQAFGYFDPTGYFGGTWGGFVNGSVNVTVLDSYNNKPVKDSFVILGWQTETPFKGRTDKRGQITLSGEDLFGPIQATAAREDYSTSTIVGVDAENITLHIDPMKPVINPGGGGGGGATNLPPGVVSGRVLGIDKYLLAKPDSCRDRPLNNGFLCRPCASDDDCGTDGICTSIASGGFHCSTLCAGLSDCPEGYACNQLVDRRTGCVPAAGQPEVRCDTSAGGAFSSGTSTAPGSMANASGDYALSAKVGEVALYCIGGLRRFDDGTFEPVAMGIVRHVPVSSARITDSVDMDLSIPLDREVDVRLINAPGGPGGPNDHVVVVSLDLGSDGSLDLWPTMTAIDGDRFVLRHLPRDFTGLLEGAVMFAHAEANSHTPDSLPYSASHVLDWTPGRDLGVVEILDGTGRLLSPDIRPDATGGCALPDGSSLVLGHQGLAWTVNLEGAIEAGPSMGRTTLRACSALGEEVLAVGDGGVVVRSGPAGTAVEAAPGGADLRAVTWLPDGTAWAAGDGTLLHMDLSGAWARVEYGSRTPLNALAAQSNGTVWAAGSNGMVVRITGTRATPISPSPAVDDLFAATTFGDLPMLVGTRGLVLLGDGSGEFTSLSAGGMDDLRAVLAQPDGTVVVGGSRGTLLRLKNGTWESASPAGFTGEVTTLVPTGQAGLVAMTGDALVLGPFLRVATFTNPINGLPWTDRTLEWTRDGPPTPSLTYTMIYGTLGNAGPWAIAAEGSIQQIKLPDLTAASAPPPLGQAPLEGLPSGNIVIDASQMLIDDFDMNSYDQDNLHSNRWRSWQESVVRPIR
jgi:hypothetical protein